MSSKFEKKLKIFFYFLKYKNLKRKAKNYNSKFKTFSPDTIF